MVQRKRPVIQEQVQHVPKADLHSLKFCCVGEQGG